MLAPQLKTVFALAFFCLGGISWASPLVPTGHGKELRVTERRLLLAQAPTVKPDPEGTRAQYRLMGFARVEGTNEPVEGARFGVLVRRSGSFDPQPELDEISTGPDGQFIREVPPGDFAIFAVFPPVGFWVPRSQWRPELIAFGPDTPVFRADYLLRRGTVWDFRLTKGRVPLGFVGALRFSRASVDERGMAQLTLPPEGGALTLSASESLRPPNGALSMSLEAAPGFRPDQLKEITHEQGKNDDFRFVDASGKSATLHASALVEPINERGRLVIHVRFPESNPTNEGELTGKVVDSQGRPIEGGRIALDASFGRGGVIWRRETPGWISDRQGRYHIRSIPRRTLDGSPISLKVIAARDGFAGAESDEFPFEPGAEGNPQTVEPIRLEPGVALSGIVVDHQGRPAVGAWVNPYSASRTGTGAADRVRSARTDEAGRFTIQDIPRGLTRISVSYGKLTADHTYLADGSRDEVRIQLPQQPAAAGRANAPRAARPGPVAVGQAAPQWLLGRWSDGRIHTLAEHQGTVVVLYFWNIGATRSVSQLPAFAQLRNGFEPRGAVFIAIHVPGEDETQVRKVLEFKQTLLLYAIDLQNAVNPRGVFGATAWNYGVRTFPTTVVIDGQGKVAFNTDPVKNPQPPAAKNGRAAPDRVMAEQETNEQFKSSLAREIEKTLDQKD